MLLFLETLLCASDEFALPMGGIEQASVQEGQVTRLCQTWRHVKEAVSEGCYAYGLIRVSEGICR
jgi:hypothetical protein